MDVEKLQKAETATGSANSIRVGHHSAQKTFSMWSALGIGHSITNSAVTILVGLASGVIFGGSPLYFYGFIGMFLVAMCVAISLGELASALPHSGGQYYWVSVLAPTRFRRFLSYIIGVVAWAGAVCTCAAVCLAVPIMVFNMTALTHPNFVYKPWMVFIGYQIVNLVAFTMNLFGRVLPGFSKGLLIFTLASVTVIFVSNLAGPEEQVSGTDFFTRFYNVSGWPDGLAALIGLNGVNWAFSCLDAVAHLADEIPEPRTNIPKALMATVGVGGFTGMLMLFSIFFATTDIDAVAAAGTPSLQVFLTVFRGNVSAAIGLQILITISSVGSIVGMHTWQSRIAWAFSRDKGFPLHRYLCRIAPEPFGTPVYAHIWSCAWVSVLGCLYLGSSLAFNSLVAGGILLQYSTYTTCIICLLCYGRDKIIPGPFWFPRFGYVANVVTIMWTFITLVFYSFPYYLPVHAGQMNYVSVVVVGTYVYALLYWVLFGRKEYKSPDAETYD